MVARRFDVAAERVLRARYEAGASMDALAQEHSTSRITIRNTLVRAGAALRRSGAQPREFSRDEKQEIARRYRDGESQEAIASALGVSQVRISRFMRAAGIVTRRGHKYGQRHPLWKGGRIVVHGYVQIHVDDSDPLFCMTNVQGYAMEHRMVMARQLGRPLTADETVHHINGDTQDNRPENLQLRTGRHGKHVAHRCLDCGSSNVEASSLS